MVCDVLAEPSAAEPNASGPPKNAVVDGRHVSLTATEFALLAALMDRPGRVLSRRQLLVAAGRETAGDRAADVYVAQLRAKIGSAANIRTVRGAGYALDPLGGSVTKAPGGPGYDRCATVPI